jgi:hypothetical protein
MLGVQVCTDSRTRDKIHRIVGEMLRENVRFEELPFCPERSTNAVSAFD